MKLYHYAYKKFDYLESMFARGLEKEGFELKKEHVGTIKERFAYNKSISFFLEPIPNNLASILHHEHGFWKKGMVLNEHVVDINNLPQDIHYRLVESREKTDMVFNKQDWDKVEGNPALREKYLEELKKMELGRHYIGYSLGELKQGIRNAKYAIKEDYENMYLMAKKYPENEMLLKYAANVPHLMTYPGELPIKVDSFNKRILT